MRTVLDVGCGEGNWLAPLRRLRPRVTIHRRRRERVRRRAVRHEPEHPPRHDRCARPHATAEGLRSDPVRGDAQLPAIRHTCEPGWRSSTSSRTALVYLELFTGVDRGVFGDTRGTRLRSAAWYRARIREARFVSCGLHCYIPDWLREHDLGDRAVWPIAQSPLGRRRGDDCADASGAPSPNANEPAARGGRISQLRLLAFVVGVASAIALLVAGVAHPCSTRRLVVGDRRIHRAANTHAKRRRRARVGGRRRIVCEQGALRVARDWNALAPWTGETRTREHAHAAPISMSRDMRRSCGCSTSRAPGPGTPTVMSWLLGESLRCGAPRATGSGARAPAGRRVA